MADIWSHISFVRSISVQPGEELDKHIETRQPFIVRGYVRDWPLVKSAQQSDAEARTYLLQRHVDRPFIVSIGGESEGGRLFYDDDMKMNARTGRARLSEVFDRIEIIGDAVAQPILYLASIDMASHFDGLVEDCEIPLAGRDLLRSIWIGMRTRIAAHNDFPDNLACVAVGRRRFTLFPPEQFRNLYLGPVDNTPAGRAISMVDFQDPDYESHPRFHDALLHAQQAVLEPGDALFIPALWWHHVEGLEAFNVLVNFWWRDTPRYLGQPQDALNHAMMSIRDLPESERTFWREMFDYYVFEAGPEVTNHIPENARSVLGPMTPERASLIRSFLLKALNR